jgi:hypothetical protein
MSAWKLGPEHPHYEYGEHDGDDENGFVMSRRWFLTDEGAAAVSSVEHRMSSGEVGHGPDGAADTLSQHLAPRAAVASSSHRYCPAVLGCRDGKLPEGWIRERKEVAS